MQLQPPAPDPRAGELGYAPMDGIHAELDELLARAAGTPDVDWIALVERIDDHLRSHFAQEDEWMQQTSFPPRDCHMEEHAAVLRSSQGVLRIAREGDLKPSREFVAELERWFPGHADYLDSALATWLCKRRYGGSPVVVRRRNEGESKGRVPSPRPSPRARGSIGR